MPDKKHFPIKKLGELCEIIGGGTPSKSNCEFYTGDIPWATVRDMRGDIISNTEFKITETAVTNSSANVIPKNNVVIATRVGLGKICFLKYDTAINQDLRGIVPKNIKQLSVHYLFWWLKSISSVIIANGAGATVQGVKLPFIKNLEIPTPALPEQQRIVTILDKAFTAIDKAKSNAEQNLKNAKEFFKSYLQGVFENRGEGWEEKNVQEFVEEGIIYKPLDGNHGEIHPLKNDYVDIGIPFIMSRDMEDGSIDEEKCKFISEKQARSLRTGFAISGDVLLSHKGTIGSVAILQSKYDFVVLTPQITYYRVKDHSKFINRFIYYQFLSPVFQKAINRAAEGGSTRAYIGITKQLSLKLIIAPLKTQQTIVQKLNALSAETKKLEAIYQTKINELEELKKSILQKTFNGELSKNTDANTNTKVYI